MNLEIAARNCHCGTGRFDTPSSGQVTSEEYVRSATVKNGNVFRNRRNKSGEAVGAFLEVLMKHPGAC